MAKNGQGLKNEYIGKRSSAVLDMTPGLPDNGTLILSKNKNGKYEEVADRKS